MQDVEYQPQTYPVFETPPGSLGLVQSATAERPLGQFAEIASDIIQLGGKIQHGLEYTRQYCAILRQYYKL